MTAQKCIFCGGKADTLCDTALGWERKRGQMEKEVPGLLGCAAWGIPIRYRLVHTCDAPLCQACAVRQGMMHVRLRYSGSFSDSIDYCPGHGFGDRRTEITGLQAEAMRTKWRAAARAQRERNAPEASQLGLFTGLLT